LPALPIGTAWFWSPGWLDVFTRVNVRRRETFDSSATPKMGKAVAAPKNLAEIDLNALRHRMAATIEKKEAEDPRTLRRRIAELEHDLQSRTPQSAVERVVERVEVPVLPTETIDGLRTTVGDMAALGDRLHAIVEEIGDALARVRAAVDPYPVHVATTGPAEVSRPVRSRSDPRAATNGTTQLRAGERRMLEVLARRHPLHVTRAQLAMLSRFSPKGGTYQAYFGTLRREGLLSDTNGDVRITQAGLDYLGADVPRNPQSTEELQAMWKSALRLGERTLLDEVIAAYPRSIPREMLGERTGYTSTGGTFQAYLGSLRRNGLIEVDNGAVRASDTLFLGGSKRQRENTPG
jgi:hypothetical protein